MLLFLDTEFSELSAAGQLLSIGVVSEQGHTFYAELLDAQQLSVSAWVSEHVLAAFVLPKTKFTNQDTYHTRLVDTFFGIAARLSSWLNQFVPTDLEIVVDVGAFDWLHFVSLFGGALNLPSYIHYIPIEFSTILRMQGIDPDINRLELAKLIHSGTLPEYLLQTRHHALYDALLLKHNYSSLKFTV